jgi:hypothetical protein
MITFMPALQLSVKLCEDLNAKELAGKISRYIQDKKQKDLIMSESLRKTGGRDMTDVRKNIDIKRAQPPKIPTKGLKDERDLKALVSAEVVSPMKEIIKSVEKEETPKIVKKKARVVEDSSDEEEYHQPSKTVEISVEEGKSDLMSPE